MSAGMFTMRELWRVASPTVMVRTSGVCRKRSPISRSSHTWMNWSTATVTIAGVASGSIIRTKICQYDAPSISDASMSSVDTPRK